MVIDTTQSEKWNAYLKALKGPFTKRAKLEFLYPDGSTMFTVDNNKNNPLSKAFIQEGSITVNFNNGQRRTANVKLANVDGKFSFEVNKIWFGTMIRLSEGLVLPNGEEFYLPQGVFYLKDPTENVRSNENTVTWDLYDKWSYLDGTLFGTLDGIYEIPMGVNIFSAIASILKLDRGNGMALDPVVPQFTDYYNGKTQTLEDGSLGYLTDTPYTYRAESSGLTYADILLEMNKMIAGCIGYDSVGRLCVEPSQDDVDDREKPVLYEFTSANSQFLGLTYTVLNGDVYNDVIIEGQSLSDYGVVGGRAINTDPKSDTNIYILGRKIIRESQNGYYSKDVCESLARFRLKRYTTLQKNVSIECGQMFHIQENQLITIQRPDKPGNPVERHLISGFERDLAQNGKMTINATSVNDYPDVTTETWPLEAEEDED